MIEFISEEVRAEFHLLPLDRQREHMEAAAFQFKRGYITTVLWVERISTTESEVAIRVDKKLDPAVSG